MIWDGRRVAVYLCLYICCIQAGLAHAQYWAGVITVANSANRTLQGPDAIGGAGDYALTNGHLCAVVSGLDHDGEISSSGGTLVDLGECGRAHEQFLGLRDLVNLDASSVPISYEIAPEIKAESASITVSARLGGLQMQTTYLLDAAEPRRLQITTRLARNGREPKVFALTSVMQLMETLRPFSVNINGGGADGYVYHPFLGLDVGDLDQSAKVVDLIVAIGDRRIDGGVAYGQQFVDAWWQNTSGNSAQVPHYFVLDPLVAGLLVLAESPDNVEDLRALRFYFDKVKKLDLEPTRQLMLVQNIWVGEQADVASVTNMIFAQQPAITGSFSRSDVLVSVQRSDGTPFTNAITKSSGEFRIHVPAADYRLTFSAPGVTAKDLKVSVASQDVNLGKIELGRPSTLILPGNSPMRLLFAGIEGTPDPDFSVTPPGYAAVDQSPVERVQHISLAGIETDPKSIHLDPGRYRVLATRGPEYSVTSSAITIEKGQEHVLVISAPKPATVTGGWIASDPHVHASSSFDTSIPADERIRSLVAQGVEVAVFSEHDVIRDYSAELSRLGVNQLLIGIGGVEVTSSVSTAQAPYTIGHGNVFPAPANIDAYRGGAPKSEGRRWRDIIGEVKQWPSDQVIQLNHARNSQPTAAGFTTNVDSRAFFTHLGKPGHEFNPMLSLADVPNNVLVEQHPQTGFRDIDFTAIELMSGKSLRAYRRLREDWFSLLRQGVRLAATAGSDAHRGGDVVGVPRLMVNMPDALSNFDRNAFVTAINQGRTYGTTGPLFEVTLGNKGPGEMLSSDSGLMEVLIDCAQWVDVARLRLFVNGKHYTSFSVSRRSVVTELMKFSHDSFVTVELEGEAGPVYQQVLPGFVPFAFSNPIFIDADRDGQWTPPGANQ